MFDLHVKNARLVTENGLVDGGFAVTAGKIVMMHTGNVEIDARQTVDIHNKLIFPGVVDAHVHFSEVGREFEGYSTGSRAAAAGGVTTVLEMPLNDLPATTDVELLRAKRNAIANQSVVDYAHWGGFINDNLSDLRAMHEAGVIGYKAFMKCCTDFPQIDDGLLEAGLRELRTTGNVIAVHAENDSFIDRAKRRLTEEGRYDRPALSEAHSKEQELEAIRRALYWAKVTGGRIHIVHVSIAEGLREVARAQLEGVRATAETCAHYLVFDEADHERLGPVARCFPPIRERDEVEKLWECALDGTLDMITSDHSPFLPEDLAAGEDDVWKGAGIRGIQSILPAMITEGVVRRGLSWKRLATLMSGRPAGTFGVDRRKGSISVGRDADFVVIDVNRRWTLESKDLEYRYPYSPYVDREYVGAIEATYVRGVPVYQDGVCTGAPGHGELVRRHLEDG